MGLSKFRKVRFSATRTFTDREEPLEVFSTIINNILTKPGDLEVLVFYGYGGIGKTALLRKLEAILVKLPDRQRIHSVWLSLDLYEVASPLHALISIRRQLKRDCPLFDFALLRYWSLVGHFSLSNERKVLNEDNILLGLGEAVVSALGKTAPFTITAKVINMLYRELQLRRPCYKAYFEEILSLGENAYEIHARLPYYLGTEIADAAEAGIHHVFFFDSFEAMLKRFSALAVNDFPDEWIRELIGSCGHGLFVVASREQLAWGRQDSAWAKALNQHLLSTLSPDDCRHFLRAVPIHDTKLVESIINASGGIPLHLDLCVSIFERMVEGGRHPQCQDFNVPAEEIVRRFLGHLDENLREAVRALSVVRFFNFDIFCDLFHDLAIGYPIGRFSALSRLSFVESIDKFDHLLTIHEIVRGQILGDLAGTPVVARAVACFIATLGRRLHVYSDALTEVLFGNALAITSLVPSLEVSSVEILLDAGLQLHDRGHWLTLIETLRANRSLPAVQEACSLLLAVCLRRVGGLEESIVILRSLSATQSHIGKHFTTLRAERAYASSLAGNYDSAYDEFEALYAAFPRIETLERPAIKAHQQYADILTLRGRFVDALRILVTLREALDDGESECLEIGETYRLEGHIYRFNLDYEMAALKYNQAFATTGDINSLKGKLYTNLAETYCWYSPDLAIEYAEHGLEINSELGLTIEQGKLQAALSIAAAMRGDFNTARLTAQRAIDQQIRGGYEAGVLFGKIALCLAATLEGDKLQADEIWLTLVAHCQRLNVYRYLLLPLATLRQRTGDAVSILNTFQWLDKTATEEALSAWKRRLKMRHLRGGKSR